MADDRTRRAVEAVWRAESARIVAALTRYTGDFSWAEDLAQAALLEALVAWPESGIPDNPGAWLMTVSKRRAVDGWRRRERLEEREILLGNEALLGEHGDPVAQAGDPDRIDDDVLRLVFIACHPVLPAQARLALTLRTVAGLTTEQIARVLLISVPATQQRIVRAKRTLADSGVPFEVPGRAERPARLASVLQVVYLLFTEGYAPTGGAHPVRPDVAREAVRLARQLAAITPDEPEVFALIALMEFQSSRFAARIDPDGLPLTLAAQDRSRWDRSAIERGRSALAHAECLRPRTRVLRAAGRGRRLSRARADRARTPTGRASSGSTTLCSELAPSPVVRLNQAVAISMAQGPEVALPLVDALSAELGDFRPLHAVRAELLERMGEADAAASAFRTAADASRQRLRGHRAAPPGRRARGRSARAVVRFAQLVEDPVEILDAREIYADLAFSGTESDADASVEAIAEAFGHLVEMRAPRARLRLGRSGRHGLRRLRGCLGGPHREVLVDDLVGEPLHRLGGAEREDRAGVAGGEHAGGHALLHRQRQLQQADGVADLRTGAPDAAGELLLRDAEVLEQLLVGGRLFERVQLRAMQVLQQRVAEQMLVGGVADDGGDRVEARPHGLRACGARP